MRHKHIMFHKPQTRVSHATDLPDEVPRASSADEDTKHTRKGQDHREPKTLCKRLLTSQCKNGSQRYVERQMFLLAMAHNAVQREVLRKRAST